jgi:hypothetical protein
MDCLSTPRHTPMESALRAVKIAALAWTTLALSATVLSGMVLCLDAHGHVALETPHEGRCQVQVDQHDHGSHVASEPASTAATACCSDCVDVPLSLGHVSRYAKGLRSLRPHKDTVAPVVADVCYAAAATGLRAARVAWFHEVPPGAPLALLALRTVVLLV